MSKQARAKIVVTFQTYNGFVLDSDKAVAVMEMLRGAEKYREKYNGAEPTTLHVYPFEPDRELVSFRYLTDEQYALAKIAGKPED